MCFVFSYYYKIEKCREIYVEAEIFMGAHKTKNKNNILRMIIIIWILNSSPKKLKPL